MRNAHLNAGFAFDGETGRLSIVLETRKGTFKSEPSSTGKTNLITAINGRIQLPDEIVAALEAEGYTGVGGNVNIYAK